MTTTAVCVCHRCQHSYRRLTPEQSAVYCPTCERERQIEHTTGRWLHWLIWWLLLLPGLALVGLVGIIVIVALLGVRP